MQNGRLRPRQFAGGFSAGGIYPSTFRSLHLIPTAKHPRFASCSPTRLPEFLRLKQKFPFTPRAGQAGLASA